MPSHITVGVADTLTLGVGVTLTVTLVILLQPVNVLVPDTVYIVVVVGVTVILVAVSNVLHVYVSAPVIFNVADWVEQIVVEDVVAFNVGKGFTSIEIVCVALIQFAVSPITV